MIPTVNAFPDFRTAAAAVLDYLHRRLGFDLWMVTRVQGQEWIILQVEDHGYGMQPGSMLKWADSFCVRMVEGEGPCVTPRALDVPAYASQPVAQQMKIGAYIGIPLTREDGSLFGTLCAIHPAPQPDQIVLEQPMIELFGRLLASILNEELKTVAGARREERSIAGVHRDGQTSLFDRTGWEQLLKLEERRCADYGNPAAVIMITLPESDRNGLKTTGANGDPRCEYLERVAGALTAATRDQDIIARVATRQFAVLAVECDRGGTKTLVSRLTAALREAAIEASLRVAQRTPPRTLWHSWREAEGAAEENTRDQAQG